MQWAETGGSLGHGKLVPIPFILFCFSWSLIFYIQRLGNIGEWAAFNEEKERHVIPGLELCARGGELRGLGSDPTQTSGGAWRAACHHSSPDITWRCVVLLHILTRISYIHWFIVAQLLPQLCHSLMNFSFMYVQWMIVPPQTCTACSLSTAHFYGLMGLWGLALVVTFEVFLLATAHNDLVTKLWWIYFRKRNHALCLQPNCHSPSTRPPHLSWAGWAPSSHPSGLPSTLLPALLL